MKQINVGLSSWIIQDGNYEDFHVGQETSFALEFYPYSIGPSNQASITAIHTHACLYQVRGKVVYLSKKAWVIDIGFLAYEEDPTPEHIKLGDDVEGDIYIGVDPFSYFELLHKLPGMPALKYSFRIEGILLDTTPWLETRNDAGGKQLARDETRVSYREVSQTNAWDDDDGHADYILRCEFLNSDTQTG